MKTPNLIYLLWMKNLKKYLKELSGKEVHSVKVTVVSPWVNERIRLSFDVEIKSAYLTNILELTFYISNRLVNGEVDDAEFEYQFLKAKFQEEFKEDTYDNFNMMVFGIEPKDFIIEYIYK